MESLEMGEQLTLFPEDILASLSVMPGSDKAGCRPPPLARG
jgi:hypothetical protein